MPYNTSLSSRKLQYRRSSHSMTSFMAKILQASTMVSIINPSPSQVNHASSFHGGKWWIGLHRLGPRNGESQNITTASIFKSTAIRLPEFQLHFAGWCFSQNKGVVPRLSSPRLPCWMALLLGHLNSRRCYQH